MAHSHVQVSHYYMQTSHFDITKSHPYKQIRDSYISSVGSQKLVSSIFFTFFRRDKKLNNLEVSYISESQTRLYLETYKFTVIDVLNFQYME